MPASPGLPFTPDGASKPREPFSPDKPSRPARPENIGRTISMNASNYRKITYVNGCNKNVIAKNMSAASARHLCFCSNVDAMNGLDGNRVGNYGEYILRLHGQSAASEYT